MPRMPRGCLALLLVSLAARADEAPGATSVEAPGVAADAEGSPSRPHAAYVELLGKHGLYGVGYDYATSERWAFGGAGAFFVVESERVLSFGPYVNFYPVTGSGGALVLQTGAEFVQVWVPSRVRGWSGASATGVSGQLSAGYEYRGSVLVRFLATGVFGQGGLRPWVGIAVGRAF